MANEHRGWIGVDLDGTLADYQGWRGVAHIGDPVPAMLLRVRRWPLNYVHPEDKMEQFVGANPREAEAALAAIHIQKWCQTHLGVVLPITCKKDLAMIQLWDDRAVQVEPNTGRRADGVDDLK
jgi:hypothetical protein